MSVRWVAVLVRHLTLLYEIQTSISTKSLTLKEIHGDYVSSGLKGLLTVTTMSFLDFSVRQFLSLFWWSIKTVWTALILNLFLRQFLMNYQHMSAYATKRNKETTNRLFKNNWYKQAPNLQYIIFPGFFPPFVYAHARTSTLIQGVMEWLKKSSSLLLRLRSNI